MTGHRGCRQRGQRAMVSLMGLKNESTGGRPGEADHTIGISPDALSRAILARCYRPDLAMWAPVGPGQRVVVAGDREKCQPYAERRKRRWISGTSPVPPSIIACRSASVWRWRLAPHRQPYL